MGEEDRCEGPIVPGLRRSHSRSGRLGGQTDRPAARNFCFFVAGWIYCQVEREVEEQEAGGAGKEGFHLAESVQDREDGHGADSTRELPMRGRSLRTPETRRRAGASDATDGWIAAREEEYREPVSKADGLWVRHQFVEQARAEKEVGPTGWTS
ncbi:hypothetical protein C8R44DRAFT_845958 [Mycena epipterygia]|nr:hypothetical protein C8R44DRAFT_845958 [Mycena epipterygia]